MFDINFYSKQSEFHRYSTEDLALLSIGLGSYNKSSVDEFFNPAKPNPDLIEFFGPTGVVANEIRGITLESTMQILEFDILNKVHKITVGLTKISQLNPQKFPPAKFPPITSAGDIKTFLDDWNRVQNGALTGPMANSYKAIVDKIHNSVSGCLLFKATFNVLGGERIADIMLVPTYSRDNESSRTMSFKGAPLISAPPQTAEGMVYSNSLTNQLPIGQYGSPFEGGSNNPKNNVAGNLRLTYDPTTGEFESGTQQILVRLVDDIDPVEMPNISGEALLLSTADECYSDPESDLFMGSFKKGRGIPLSMENGNPHMYGPNFKGGCSNSSAKSVILVVNRSPQGFKSGQLVMCSKINGEWVILPTGGQEGLKKKLTFGNFEYQQYIIPASRYFAFGDNTIFSHLFGPLERALPSDVARKIRNFYYVDLAANGDPKIVDPAMNDVAKLASLNIFASTIPIDIEDPIQYIKDNYTPEEAAILLNEADQEKTKDQDQLFLEEFIRGAGVWNFAPDRNFNEITNALPKNVLSRKGRSLFIYDTESGMSSSSVKPDDLPLYGMEVPFFWGMLFPDGYKSDSTSKFISINRETFRTSPLFENDSTLKELSVLSTLGYPFLTNEIANLALIEQIRQDTTITDPFKYVKKTTGVFTEIDFFDKIFTGDYIKNIYDLISFNTFTTKRFDILNRFEGVTQGDNGDTISAGSHIFGLEPLKPNILQFSSMSIEHLYSRSLLDADPYIKLKTSIDYFYQKAFRRSDDSFWVSTPFFDVIHDWWREDSRDEIHIPRSGDIDENNAYNIQSLLAKNFVRVTADRHPSPLGTAFLILPNLPMATPGAFARSVVMPVLTCKYKIRTSADSLNFDTSQLFGMPQRTAVSPADINEPVILPGIGLVGLAWNLPDTPISVNSFPQWGDRIRSDNVDSFGTTALHVRVFEGWPIEQTIYLGHCFTPLHFNASAPDIDKTIIYSETGTPSLGNATENGVPIPGRSNVDFRVPTLLAGENLGGAPMGVGNSVTATNLAPYSEWKWNTVRRAKLLTGGGFIYEIKYVGIVKASISIKNGGTGYSVGDSFLYPDGTTITILDGGVDGNGKISGGGGDGGDGGDGGNGGGEPVAGADGDGGSSGIDIVEGEQGITRVLADLQPQYIGSTGSGAVWNNVKFIVKEKYGYDPGPKEIAPITRLTNASNNGEDIIEGKLSVSVPLNSSNNTSKEYDVFYFYHNDPSHYVMDETLSYNAGWAQYAIVEVNPGA